MHREPVALRRNAMTPPCPRHSPTMLLRLSRLSFWLAAAVAAVALLAPGGHETALTAVCGVASALALLLWRSALHGEQRVPAAALAPDSAPLIDEASLLDAAALLVRQAHAAPTFEAALHAVARVLRSELGAREATVHEVRGVDGTHAQLSNLVDSQPGFRTVARRIRLDNTPIARALQSQSEAGAPPGAIALPVLRGGHVAAVIELHGIGVPVAPQALAGLLRLARTTLSQSAPAAAPVQRSAADSQRPPQHANVLVVEDNVGQPEFAARAFRGLGCRVTVASGMLDGLNLLRRTQFDLVLIDMQMSGLGGAEGLRRFRQRPDDAGEFMSARDTPVIALSVSGSPGNGERLLELGFDDYLFKPFRQGQLLAMMSKQLRPSDAAESGDSPVGGRVEPAADAGSGAQPVLDPVALGRLTELDPKGENRLLERVLQAFQTSVARLRPQLDAARRDGDRAAIRLVVHTLKSSSASIGAMRLSQLCAQIETSIRNETDEDLSGPLAALDDALDGASRAIDALLKERA